jgi:transposase
MRPPVTQTYPAALKERAVNLAVESEPSLAQTARELGVHENPRHTWIGQYHRAERQEKEVNDAPVSEALQRLRQENARLQEEREIVKKAAASCAQPLPCSTPGCPSSTPRSRCVQGVGFWTSRAVGMTSG